MDVHTAHCFFDQLVKKLISKSKNAAGHVVNVLQVKIQFIQNVHIIQGRNQDRQGRNQSHHIQHRQMLGHVCAQTISPVPDSLIFLAIFKFHSASFMSPDPSSSSTIKFLCSHLKQVSRLTAQHSVAQQAFGGHRLTCSISLSLIDLHTKSDVPMVRSARSAHEATQFKEELNTALRPVTDTVYKPSDSTLSVLIKWCLRHSGERSWDNHHSDVLRFLKSFHQLNGSVPDFVASEGKEVPHLVRVLITQELHLDQLTENQ